MRFGSLFAGIGAIDPGLEMAGMECRWQVEIDEFANEILEKHWPKVRRYKDIRQVDGKKLEKVDLVCGGFPCTDISVAGKGAGLQGEQSGLWFEMFRVVQEVRPRWILIENVSALRTRGADAVLDGLETEGYSCWPVVVGAREVGAPHKRARVFIVARLADAAGAGLEGYRTISGEPQGSEPRDTSALDGHASAGDVANSDSHGYGVKRVRRLFDGERAEVGHDVDRRDRWPARRGDEQHPWEVPRVVKFAMGKSVDGVTKRLVRASKRKNRFALKALGNSCVPQVVRAIGKSIFLIDMNTREK